MKRTFSLLIALTLSLYSFGQIDSTKVSFVSYWSVGDSYDFKVSKIKQQWKEGNLEKDQKQEYIANFTVIDSTETSYTVNWTYENDLGSNFNIPDELQDRFSKYKLTKIVYKTSELGELLEIINWKEVSDMMTSMFKDIIDVSGKNKEEKKTLEGTLKPFLEIYSTKEGIEGLVLKELQYFHFPMGLEYDITEPILYEDEIQNMFGGNPIKADAKIYFEDVEFENDFCVMKQELKLNTSDTKDMLTQLFEKMNLGDIDMTEFLKNSIFEITDNNTFEYYYYPGVPHRIETSRQTIVDIASKKRKSIDKTIIELIYQEE